jgi:hypothetical protein
MSSVPRKLTLEEWGARYEQLRRGGLREPAYNGPLGRHVRTESDLRLRHLRFDDSPAALRLWNFLLTENQRLAQARAAGDKIVGAMKDLGTVPVMAYSLPRLRAFYPDGAWWTPCLMERSDGLLQQAERLGLDASFCPVEEGAIIREVVHRQLGLPTVELEVPPICDALEPALSSRVQALLETARSASAALADDSPPRRADSRKGQGRAVPTPVQGQGWDEGERGFRLSSYGSESPVPFARNPKRQRTAALQNASHFLTHEKARQRFAVRLSSAALGRQCKRYLATPHLGGFRVLLYW